MTWRAGPTLIGALVVVVVGVVVALTTASPEALVLVTPLAVLVVAGLAVTDRLDVTMAARCSAARALEGQDVEVVVELRSRGRVPAVEVLLDTPDGLAVGAPGRLRGTSLRPRSATVVSFPVRCERWGTYAAGTVWVRAHSPFGLLRAEGRLDPTERLRVYPRPEAIRRLLPARDTVGPAGSQSDRSRGAGIEFADLRPMHPGDPAREINWRATARRGTPWVNQRHPDRSRDVVVFLDSFGGPTLPAAVRAADSLVTAYLRGRDRVGLVSFGGFLQWVRPGMGLRQQYVVVDTLLATREFVNVAWKGIGLVPPRVLPVKSMVIAVTPLEDERMLRAMIDLRARGVDLVVVEVSPTPFAPAAATPEADLGHRLWQLEREARRDGYRRLGVPVVVWDPDRPLSVAVEELGWWRRSGPRAG